MGRRRLPRASGVSSPRASGVSLPPASGVSLPRASGATPAATRTCPCGLPAAYDACCGRLHAGAGAPTAELLMRSRYTAYAVRDEAHLLASWHPSTRPRSVPLDPALRWTGLEVLSASGGLLDTTGTVHFRASWAQGGERGVLEERSRFARDAGRWAYVGEA